MSTNGPPSWVRDCVFYQILPDRFARSGRVKPERFEGWDSPPTLLGFKGGDLWGVIERLGYLRDLGVNALYLCPIFSSTANHRYHTHDYHQVDPLLGGFEAFEALMREAKAKGFRVILDGVFNHASRSFLPFAHTLAGGRSSPYVDWFHFNPDWLASDRPIDAYAPDDPRAPTAATKGSFARYGYAAWWDLRELPKFNTENPAVRAFLFDVAERWMRCGIDGWRLDVPDEIADDSFWRELRRRVREVNPDAYLVAESWDNASAWFKEPLFDGAMNYPFAKACLGFTLGANLNRAALDGTGYRDIHPMTAHGCAEALQDLVERHPMDATFCQLNLLGSHDTPRILNAANGDRNAVKLAFTCLLGFPGAPCIYYGDEIGTAGGSDPDCRRAFEWDERLWDTELSAHVTALARLRRQSRALRRGGFRVWCAGDGGLAWERVDGDAGALVAVNVGSETAEFEFPPILRQYSWEQLRVVASAPGVGSLQVNGVGAPVLRLGARASIVLSTPHG